MRVHILQRSMTCRSERQTASAGERHARLVLYSPCSRNSTNDQETKHYTHGRAKRRISHDRTVFLGSPLTINVNERGADGKDRLRDEPVHHCCGSSDRDTEAVG